MGAPSSFSLSSCSGFPGGAPRFPRSAWGTGPQCYIAFHAYFCFMVVFQGVLLGKMVTVIVLVLLVLRVPGARAAALTRAMGSRSAMAKKATEPFARSSSES